MHLNIKILLPKIDEQKYIARLGNATATEISRSCLDKSFTNDLIEILTIRKF